MDTRMFLYTLIFIDHVINVSNLHCFITGLNVFVTLQFVVWFSGPRTTLCV